jgi:hypothetical protein
MLAVPPTAGPVVVTDPLAVGLPVVVVVELPVAPVDVADENEEMDGSDVVGALRESDPLFAAVWACAAVEPKTMIAVRIVRRIRVLLLRYNRRFPFACDARQRPIRLK